MTKEAMTFLEAFTMAKETGCSIVPCRYTEDAKGRVQYYFNFVGQFINQAGSSKTSMANLAGDKHLIETWELYKGGYEQLQGKDNPEFKRYLELKESLLPIIKDLQEFQKLQKKYEV